MTDHVHLPEELKMVFSKKPTDMTSKTAFKKLSDFADYREAKDRLDELTEQRRELQATITELESQIGEGKTDGRDDIRAEASAMLSGGTATLIAKPDVRSELSEAKQRLAVVSEAVEMQQKAVNQVTGNCQIEMAAERRLGHAATVQRMDARPVRLATWPILGKLPGLAASNGQTELHHIRWEKLNYGNDYEKHRRLTSRAQAMCPRHQRRTRSARGFTSGGEKLQSRTASE